MRDDLGLRFKRVKEISLLENSVKNLVFETVMGHEVH